MLRLCFEKAVLSLKQCAEAVLRLKQAVLSLKRAVLILKQAVEFEGCGV